MILRQENVRLLREHGLLIWLQAPASVLQERIRDDTQRPALKDGKTFLEEIEEVLAERTPLYRAAANHALDTTALTPEEVAERIQARVAETMKKDASSSGVGGTLSGNALAVAAMRTNLEKVMTEEAYHRMTTLAERLAYDIKEVPKSRGLPWHVIRLGARVEYGYSFLPQPPRNGSEAQAGEDLELDRLMHLMALNRGILLTPFHYMALVSPETTENDVDRYNEVFAECVDLLIG